MGSAAMCEGQRAEGKGVPWCLDPWLRRQAPHMWNVTSLVGKEPMLEQEVERYQLDIIWLTSTNSTGAGTKLLELGWTSVTSV